MRSREILVLAGLIPLVLLAASLVWDVLLADIVRAWLYPGDPIEPSHQHWHFLQTMVGAGVVAAIVPVWLALRFAAKHAEAVRELELAQERVKVIEANPDWLWEVDETMVFTHVGPKVRDLLGYEPGEVIGRKPFDFMPPAEAERVAAEAAAIIAERRSFSLLESLHRHKDGRLVVIETSGVPIFDKQGVHRGYRGINRDVTEHKAKDRQLADQKALLEAVFEAIPDAVAVTDMDRKITAVNRGFTETFGYTSEEIVGQRSAVLYESEEEFRRQGELRYNPAADGPTTPYILRYRRKNGEIFPVEIRGGIFRDVTGTKIGYLAILRDVAERLAMERRLQEVRKMEAIGQLTAGIAHDYNNLLQVIQGSLDLANHLVGGGNRQVRDLLRNALEASRRGARITRQLLSFGRRDILYTRSVAVGELVEGLLGLLQGRLGDGIRIVTDLDSGLPPIAADPHSLEASLLHIADNARAAMPHGGRLTIRATARHLNSDLAIEDGKLAAGAYVEIAVTDTGCGMSERVREKAFEPFFTTRPPGENSGLGLSVVQGFARQSGGHASLSSMIGEGTTVTLLLPVAADGTE